MTEQFDKHKWIFEPDGSLLDIYVQETTLEDWMTLIEYLNANYKLKYVPTSANETEDRINKSYITQILTDKTGELECRTVSIFTDNIIINSHFFLQDQIEFDADPREFKGQGEFEAVIEFMKIVSKLLNKEVILTGEGAPHLPLITINASTGLLKFSTQEEIKQLAAKSITLTGRIRGWYIFNLMKLLPKLKDSKFKDWLTDYVIGLTGATKPHVATKKRVPAN